MGLGRAFFSGLAGWEDPAPAAPPLLPDPDFVKKQVLKDGVKLKVLYMRMFLNKQVKMIIHKIHTRPEEVNSYLLFLPSIRENVVGVNAVKKKLLESML